MGKLLVRRDTILEKTGVNDHPHSRWLGFYCYKREKTGARSAPIVAGGTGCQAPGLENPIHRKPHVDKLRLHDLRHTCATNLARAGKDIKLIAQYFGHADVKSAARYIHYPDADLKAAVETLGRSPINTPIRPIVLAVKP